MKTKIYWLTIVVMCLSMVGASPQTVLAQGGTLVPYVPPEEPAYVPGQVIVKFDTPTRDRNQSVAAAESVASAMSGKVLDVRGNSFLMSVDEGTDVLAFTADFNENIQAGIASMGEGIAYSQPNYIFDLPEDTGGDTGDVTPKTPRPNDEEDEEPVTELKKRKTTTILPTYPNDPLLYNTWGWWDSNTDVIWQEKAAAPLICIVDTGVDAAHPDLAGKIINGMDIVNNDPIADDDNGHGTHVAGILAAKANNKIGLAGVSNAKVLAVKVLDAVGSGNSWDIADGIRFCANNTAVKVINMSFGSYAADEHIYEALKYAIVNKGKIAVAAAGNDSSNFFTFPAAWAAPFICSDGDYFPDTVTECNPANWPTSPNVISHGLISVGASRSYWSDAYDGYHGGVVDSYLWVDTNGDDIENVTDDTDPDFWLEHSPMSWCAASFSNFGKWVSIVAPGENVTSTVPVSYPFNEQYTWGADEDGDGYDTWNGTSMATPFVSAAAARLWSVGAKVFGTAAFTNADIKDQLVSSGYTVATAVDPDMNLPEWGYGYNPFTLIDNDFGGEAPYCWPDANASTIDPLLFDMSDVHVLDLADAMNRVSLYAYVYNAINGLPLRGATVGAYRGTTLVSAGLLTSNTSPAVVLPNLPSGQAYDIKITKPGFTNGAVVVSKKLSIPDGFSHISDPSISVSIPPIGKIVGVTDWTVYDPAASDMDMYAWIPEVSSPNLPGLGRGGIVGFFVNAPAFQEGGRLYGQPYARWNRDGGTLYAWGGTESISIMPKAGFPTIPMYNSTNADYYDFIIYEYEFGALNANDIYFRLWTGGNIKATVIKTQTEGDVCDTDGADNILDNADDEAWWQPGYMVKDKFFYWNDVGRGTDPVLFGGGKCGKGDTYDNGGQWPYIDYRTSGTPSKPQ